MSEEIDWSGWERRIVEDGVTLDRPRGSRHPTHPEIVYPIDYGYVNGTTSSDGEEVDVFVGTAETGLVAVIRTRDHRKGDEELKLLWNCTPSEIYLVNGFINFDRRLMEGTLVMRHPMERLWDERD
jgi:hypothetical protein